MTVPFTVACLQTRPKATFGAALEEALDLADAAVEAGASLLALPEYCGGLKADGACLAPPHAAEDDHPVIAGLTRFAAGKSVNILIGSVAITGPDGKIRNRSLLVNGQGEIVARYDKVHLFDVRLSETEVYRESAKVAPGTTAVVADTCQTTLGLSICYDLRFPSLYRTLAKAGARLLAIPAAFTKTTGQVHWHVLNRARAIENGCYVIAPCAIGDVPGGGESYGHSLVIDPWGRVLGDGGEQRGIVTAEIDPGEVDKARGRVPSLSHDRPYQVDVAADASATGTIGQERGVA